MGEGVVKATFPPLYPGKTNWYQLYRRLGGSQGEFGRVGKISPPPVFVLRTVCPVASLIIYKNHTNIL
jgi:hypothetical protein